MTTSDLDTLLDMGFDRERATLAVQQTGGLQDAIDWLEAHQDKSLDDIKAAADPASTTTGATTTLAGEGDVADKDALEPGAPPLKEGEVAQSLVCNDCGKRFRSHAQAEFHASKTEHVDFSESTEAVAPLSEAERAEKLNELRTRLATKRAAQAAEDAAATKRNEEIRRKNTKEASDAKEELQRREQVKQAQAQRREKNEELEAKKRIKAKIEADKEERRLKAEKEKAQRMGQTFPTGPLRDSMPEGVTIPGEAPASATFSSTSSASAAKPAASTARLRLSHAQGTTQLTLPADTTLFELAHTLATETSGAIEATSFTATFGPRKMWGREDFGMTLREVGWVPSAAVVVK